MSYGVATLRVITCLLELRFVCLIQEVRGLWACPGFPQTQIGEGKGEASSRCFIECTGLSFSPILCCDQTLQLSCSSSQGEAKGLLWGDFRGWFGCRFERNFRTSRKTIRVWMRKVLIPHGKELYRDTQQGLFHQFRFQCRLSAWCWLGFCCFSRPPLQYYTNYYIFPSIF